MSYWTETLVKLLHDMPVRSECRFRMLRPSFNLRLYSYLGTPSPLSSFLYQHRRYCAHYMYDSSRYHRNAQTQSYISVVQGEVDIQ